MYPTSVPTHSVATGTSFWITGSTLTTGAGGGTAAPDVSRQPVANAARATSKRGACQRSITFAPWGCDVPGFDNGATVRPTYSFCSPCPRIGRTARPWRAQDGDA